MLGSQFFITLGEDIEYLDAEHCVFGEVTVVFSNPHNSKYSAETKK